MSKGMFDALKADADKLRDLTGEPQPFMVTCDNCGGEGGWEIVTGPTSKWGDPTPGGEWVECPTCHGSGWLDGDEPPPAIEQDELPPPQGDDIEAALDELTDYVASSRGVIVP